MREWVVLSAVSLPSDVPYEVVVPYSMSEVAGLDVVQEIVAAEEETDETNTFEMTGGEGGVCAASVVNFCAEPYAVSPDEVFETAL